MKILTSLICLFFVFNMNDLNGQTIDDIPPRMREKIKQMKVWQLTDKLNLSEDQSLQFFPVYKKFMDDTEAIREKRNTQLQQLNTNLENLSETEIETKLKDLRKFEEENLNRYFTFIEESEKILTPKQQATLVIFEFTFIKNLAKMIEQNRLNRRGNIN